MGIHRKIATAPHTFPLTHAAQDPLRRSGCPVGTAFLRPSRTTPLAVVLLRTSPSHLFSRLSSLTVKFRTDSIFLSLYKHHSFIRVPFLLRESPSPGHCLFSLLFPRFSRNLSFHPFHGVGPRRGLIYTYPLGVCYAYWTKSQRFSSRWGRLGDHFLKFSFSAPILISSSEAPAA